MFALICKTMLQRNLNQTETLNSSIDEMVPQLLSHLSAYQAPVLWRSLMQIATSLVPLIGLLVLMHFTYAWSYPVTLLISIVASIFVIRTFIIQHDCGHGSFFKGRTANAAVGWICSFFTFFPYSYWRHQHALHHAANGKLDERGNGDVFLLTAREYLALSSWGRIKYRLIRNPVTLFVFGPLVLFFVMNRFVYDPEHTPLDVRRGLYVSNLVTIAMIFAGGLTLGWAETTGILLPVVFFSGLFGTILFYVQHQFEDTYFESGKEWNYFRAALLGSSFFDLPRFLHWCSGNIGYHHVHHLAPKIPNYHLAECHYTHNGFDVVRRETVSSFLKTFKLAVWDEDEKRLVSCSDLMKRHSSARECQ